MMIMLNVTTDGGSGYENIMYENNDLRPSSTEYMQYMYGNGTHDVSYPPRSPLVRFHEWFSEIHGYASIVVCVFGILTNIFNITVLMAKDMRTPTNYLLTFLAISDILTMLPYIPLMAHFYCPPLSPYDVAWKFTYAWMLYMAITICILATTHTIAIWLAVTLAAFRFSQIRSPCPRGPLARERRICRVKMATAFICLASICVLIPNYVSQEIVLIPIPGNTSAFTLKDPKLATSETDTLSFVSTLTYAIIAKLLPCVLISVFSGSLLYHMGLKTARRRQRLSTTRQQMKTTRMLFLVLILFIFTELPQGILLVLSATVPGFHTYVHGPLGDFTDFISLLNNAINFILYCVMSQQFRDKFFNIYIKPLCERRRNMITSTSELLILREHGPRTTTTTTAHDDNNARV